MMDELRVRLEAIQTGSRHRAALGDVEGLAKSIADIGLINPITLTEGNRLVAGARRVAAVRLLGWEDIPARYVDNLDDAAAVLRAERDENTERKAMTPSELVSLGRALEELERPKAAARKAQAPGAPRGEKFSPAHVSGRDGEVPRGEVDEIVAAAVGMSPATYKRAKKVVVAAESGDPDAVQALADMDATGNVAGSYRKVATMPDRTVAAVAARKARIAELAASGNSSGQIGRELGMTEESVRATARYHGIEIRADVVLRRTRRGVDSNRIVRATVNTLDELAAGLSMVDFAAIDVAEVDGWVASLTKSRKAFLDLIKSLTAAKETTE